MCRNGRKIFCHYFSFYDFGYTILSLAIRKRTVEKYFLVLLICQLADWLLRTYYLGKIQLTSLRTIFFLLHLAKIVTKQLIDDQIFLQLSHTILFLKRISCIALVTIVKMMSTKLGLFYGWCMFTVPTYILHTFSMVTLCIYVIYKMIHHRSDNFSLYIYIPISTHSICK